MKRLVLTLFLMVALVTPLQAQDAYSVLMNRFLSGETVSNHQTAQDVNIALLVRYKGSLASGLVEVQAGGDIVFTSGAESSEVADTTLECPVSGALGGIIDVSNAACDTVQEVADIINGSASDWVAAIVDALPSDSTNNTLFAAGPSAATATNGLSLLWDSNVANHVTFALTEARTLPFYVGGTPSDPQPINPFRSRRAVVYEVNYNVDFSVSGGTLQVISVDPVSQTETIVFAQAAADATATLFDRKPFGIMGRKGEKLLVRFVDAGTLVGVTLVSGYGTEWRDVN